MPQIDLTSPIQLKEILRRHGLRPKKGMGQNFLIDRNTVDKIIDAMDISEGDPVLEIGPGVGVLTLALAEKGANIVAVELDRDMVEILKEVVGSYPNVKVISKDFLRLDLPSFIAEEFGDRPVKVVGNLPYNITSPIITALFTVQSHIERIVMMIQREVAERINATPVGREYGSMSVFVQYHAETEIVAQIPNTVFLPSPDVQSALVRMRPRQKPPVDAPSEKAFFDVVHSAFARRRKTLLNSLSECPPLALPKDMVQAVLARAEIDHMRRAETLSLEEFAKIARAIEAENEGGLHAGTSKK